MAGPGPQAPAHQQPLLVQLAEVRARLESGKRKLAEAEIEMQVRESIVPGVLRIGAAGAGWGAVLAEAVMAGQGGLERQVTHSTVAAVMSDAEVEL